MILKIQKVLQVVLLLFLIVQVHTTADNRVERRTHKSTLMHQGLGQVQLLRQETTRTLLDLQAKAQRLM